MPTSQTAAFNGVKIFSATLARDRAVLGERVTAWIDALAIGRVVEVVVRQSSDSAFHCLTVAIFWRE